MALDPSARRKAGRPRSDIRLSRQVHYRVTEDEFRALETLAAVWAEKLRAQGIPLTGDNRNAWFRATLGDLRRQAEAQGVQFPEPFPVEAPSVEVEARLVELAAPPGKRKRG